MTKAHDIGLRTLRHAETGEVGYEVMVGGGLCAWGLARLGKVERHDARLLGASFAQVGEFSFVLAGVGVAAGLMTRPTHDLVLAAALISIALNPFVLRLADAFDRRRPNVGAALPAH